MNSNEILESIKKAFKLTTEKLDNHYMFYLDEM
ncbi:MAG: amino acid ABC transporter substrate-binding protein, partial [Gammaproteobacteria bacterium]|nr:amino acid ABC transporter substrate-binding protein [Gammaproteobacteria bacterium]